MRKAATDRAPVPAPLGGPHARLFRLAARLRLAARHRVVPVARAAYIGAERSPLAPLIRLPAVQRLKSKITYMPESRVLALMSALAAARVQCWVAGGWGVDALLGRQTRRHYDLDLVIGDTREDIERIGRVLARAGFSPGTREVNPGLLMPSRHAWQDASGCTVEVMPVPLGVPPFSAVPAARGGAAEPPFTHGTIGGRKVPCLSARLQFALHQGYAARAVDEADMVALRAAADRAEGTAPA